jgi:hypothetical protein
MKHRQLERAFGSWHSGTEPVHELANALEDAVSTMSKVSCIFWATEVLPGSSRYCMNS